MSFRGPKSVSPVAGVIAWIVALLMFFPIFWMLLTSFKTEVEAVQTPPLLFFHPTVQGYREIFQQADYLSFAWNSVVVSFGSTFIALVIAVPAAFAMALYPTVRTRGTLLWMLSTKMLPAVGVLMPIYLATQARAGRSTVAEAGHEAGERPRREQRNGQGTQNRIATHQPRAPTRLRGRDQFRDDRPDEQAWHGRQHPGPRASTAAGFSPTARRRKPKRVL